MSDSSDSEEHNTKVYKLRSRKNFHSWKQKTLSLASSKGYERFLLEDVKVEKESEIEAREAAYIAEKDIDRRRKLKSEWGKALKVRRQSLKAAAMLTCCIKDRDLKMLSKHKKGSKENV